LAFVDILATTTRVTGILAVPLSSHYGSQQATLATSTFRAAVRHLRANWTPPRCIVAVVLKIRLEVKTLQG